MSLTKVFSPQSIAFIGGRDAAEAIRICQRFGFAGDIWPVSASRDQMHGIPCYASISDLPYPPDVAFVGVNRLRTIEVIQALSTIGAGGAICYASGFSESVSEIANGDLLEQELLTAAGDMPILGPNCYGFINAASGACIWPSEHGLIRCQQGVAIISQSTNIVMSMTMQQRGLPIVSVMTVGNQAQTGMSDLAMAALNNPHVTALGMYIEGIDDIHAFEAMSRHARALGKPIVVLKAGRSQASQLATLSHTASLAGADRMADAYFKRLGIARVDGFSAFLETLKLLHVHGPLPDSRLCSMSCSGGEASMLADAAERFNVTFPPLNKEQHDAVKATLSDIVTVANPLDYHTFIWGDKTRLAKTYAAMFNTNMDLAILVLDWVRTDRCSDKDWFPALEALEIATKQTKARTALIATMPENLPEDIAKRLITAGIAPLLGIEDALAAIEAAAFIGKSWGNPLPAQILPATPIATETIILDEHKAKILLSEFGLMTPVAKIAKTPIEAAELNLKFPVVVKGVGIVHKTEANAVRLNLQNPTEVRQAAEGMKNAIGFLVEEMVPKASVELIIGAVHDPVFGLSLTIGAGGILTEILQDSITLTLPVSQTEIKTTLQNLHIWPLLQGYRGAEAVDLPATINAIMATVNFIIANANNLVELDVNPLMCGPWGAVAADALIRIRKPS